MDLASLIGLLGAILMILGSMVVSGGLGPYIDIPSILIVFGGTAFGVLYAVPMKTFTGHFSVMAKVFKPPVRKPDELIARMVELAGMARKDGLMALEGKEVPDPFMQKGMQMLVDGADEAKMVKALKADLAAMKVRHTGWHDAMRVWIDLAPAMGMIGTLVGLVAMLGAMEDPKSIGPAMAVALLTTLYGAFLANVIFGPMVAKLSGYSAAEAAYREMVIEGLRTIARGESPRTVQDNMIAILPPREQQKLQAA